MKDINNFNIFGSKSSLDRDILVYLEDLPSLEACKKLSLELNPLLETLFDDNKKVNTNFGVVKDGVLIKVFKGTVDEVNNSVFLTYKCHEQRDELEIKKLLPRNFHQKILRVARIILSFYSRTEYRPLVKAALMGDLHAKIACLRKIDLSKKVNFDKNGSDLDIKKNLAFQFGQVLGLADNIELYSKEDIAETYPELSPFLFRQESKDLILEQFKYRFCILAEREIPKMTKLTE